MTNDASSLKSTLNHLHEQLGALDRLTPEQREQLRAALAEIQSTLAGKKSHEQESLMRRLGEMAGQLEHSHPTLATSLGSLINTLGNSGI